MYAIEKRWQMLKQIHLMRIRNIPLESLLDFALSLSISVPFASANVGILLNKNQISSKVYLMTFLFGQISQQRNTHTHIEPSFDGYGGKTLCKTTTPSLSSN